ncbi:MULTISPECIES: N-acetylmuramoyl-L-alanine amidase [unclassified Adlercreutzia]|uniref:N-acetylmuramoyl-L-alanine amidase n=1 Tax=unclassified Adlercreutzia TaxID=2636013 RepID=UPI001980C672|nr:MULTISPECIES: N-acetylmuramoyl-L-alanine amidase [unclassified Adlercreutzia]
MALCLLLVLSMALLPATFAPRPAEAASDGLVVAIDVGHGRDPWSGAYDPGAWGNGVEEASANLRIAQACAEELKTYAGVKVVFTSQFSASRGLEPRVQSGVDQGADVIISFHCNSAGASSANGSEVWVPNSSAYLYNETHVAGRNLGNSILNNLSALGFYNRGTKTRNCTDGENYPHPGGICDWYGINYWSRWKGIPGIIIEHGFLTNPGDAAKLGDASWCKSIGVADATGIAAYYGLSKEVADPNLEKTGEEVSTKVESTYESDPAIMGASYVSVERMVSWFNSKKHPYPSDTYAKYGAATIEEFCRIVSEEAAAEGVRAEVVFAQSMKETGWLRFGGQVKAEQCNFSGLGATDGGAAGADFSSHGANAVRIGLRAQVQHLKAYATTEPLKNECVDPRVSSFDSGTVTRGCAPTVKGLTGKWATSQTYGDDLTRMINELVGATSKATSVKFSLADVPSSLVNSGVAYVDGVAKPLKVEGGYGFVDVAGSGAHSVALYEFNSASADPHAVYPTHMYVWTVTAQGGSYVAKRYYGFDDLLRYAGSSIRITGKKGIRMITGMASGTKSALTGRGVLGYIVVETGTLLAWSDRVEGGSLTLDTPGVSRGKAYVAGKQNPVFNKADGVESYTNVLVGFSSAEQYRRDMAMRSYAILKDSAGNQFVVYGGTVQRNILYIAEQNADAFSPGTAAYDFVHGIINACKG